MSTKALLKRSLVPDHVPTTNDLLTDGEVAINYGDPHGKLFYRNHDGNIIEMLPRRNIDPSFPEIIAAGSTGEVELIDTDSDPSGGWHEIATFTVSRLANTTLQLNVTWTLRNAHNSGVYHYGKIERVGNPNIPLKVHPFVSVTSPIRLNVDAAISGDPGTIITLDGIIVSGGLASNGEVCVTTTHTDDSAIPVSELHIYKLYAISEASAGGINPLSDPPANEATQFIQATVLGVQS